VWVDSVERVGRWAGEGSRESKVAPARYWVFDRLYLYQCRVSQVPVLGPGKVRYSIMRGVTEYDHVWKTGSPLAKLWSFDHAECKGGALHEYFPAAGFRTPSGVTVGLLTDSGSRNQWSRIIRRDGTPVKPAPASIPDLNLYLLPTAGERAQQGAFIQQTFYGFCG